MLDIKMLREDPHGIEAKLKTKDPAAEVLPLLKMDEEIRRLKAEGEELKSQRNKQAKSVGEKKRNGEDVTELLKNMTDVGDQIKTLDHNLSKLEKTFELQLASLPNIPDPSAKVSLNPEENVCIKTFGEKKAFDFTPQNHLELSEKLRLFDFKRGSKIGGSGWVCYRGWGARLEWALIQFMIDTHISNGFELWIPPLLGKPDILFGSAHLPKFESQLYKVDDEDYNLYLIPTSEAVLNGLHYDEVLDADLLPFRYTAYTPCFRREAGAAGAGERGLIRTHQFNKVEMFCITKPDQSEALFDEMLKNAESILEALNLHYRRMLLVTGDMSFASSKTIDLEVFLPGQDRYYEVSSISHCTDFQARRSKMRFKSGADRPQFCHTLNGSGLATSRLMVSLLENNQESDGSVVIPTVLHKYLDGKSRLSPEELL